MRRETDLSSGDAELERALRSLPAAGVRVDVVEAAFVAGRNSGRRALRAWQSATAVLLVGALVPHVLQKWPSRPAAAQSGAMVVVEVAPVVPRGEVPAQSLLALDRTVRVYGVDGLPRANPPGAAPMRAKGDSI